MKKLLGGLLLTVLFSSHAWCRDMNTVEAEVLAKATSSWNGEALPEYARGTPEVTIMRFTIPPGLTLPLHYHPVINAGIMLKGELTVVTEDGATLHLKAGDPIVEVVNTWHYGRNEGDEPVEIVVFYAGIEDQPINIKKNTEKQ